MSQLHQHQSGVIIIRSTTLWAGKGYSALPETCTSIHLGMTGMCDLQIIRGQALRGSFPSASEYLHSARQRAQDKTLPQDDAQFL